MKIVGNKKIYLILFVVLAVLLTAIGTYFLSQKNRSSFSDTTLTVGTKNGEIAYFSNINDSDYLYRFDKSSHRLARLSRSTFGQSGKEIEFNLVEEIGPTDKSGQTIVRGSSKDGSISQSYVCNFAADCRAINPDIEQVLLSPGDRVMAIKYENEQYKLGYYDPAKDELSPVYILDLPDYEIKFIDAQRILLSPVATSLEDVSLSILNLAEGKISKEIDKTSFFALSSTASEVLFARADSDKAGVYLFNLATSEKIGLGKKNFHSFFFNQKGELYEFSVDSSLKLVEHKIESGKDKSETIKDFAEKVNAEVAEIIWLKDGKYLVVFGDGLSREFDFGI